jgi:gamma-glutamylcysteine synthetase
MMKRLAFAVPFFVVGIFAFAPAVARAQENARTIVNAEWVVEAQGAHSEAFSVKQQSTLKASVKAVKNADKGFRVRVVNAEDVISCRVTGGNCRELPAWKQDVAKALTKSSQIPPGNWAFLVENYQNIIKKMTVRVFVSVKE